MIKIAYPVGPGRTNKPADVKTVQALLNRNIGSLTPLRPLAVDGRFGPASETAIREFQTRVMRVTASGIVAPGSPTLLALDKRSAAVLPGALAAQASEGIAGIPQARLVEAARQLACEVAAIMAVVETEVGIRGPFDSAGRPTVLFERHYFSKLTQGKYDKANPDIANPVAGGYGKFSEQYPKLERAAKLDRQAAWKSASWGAFQIMGANHVQAGHASIDSFVAAMQKSVLGQLDAFVAFVKGSASLQRALRTRNWTAFAKEYNGPSYAANHYDVKMRDNYNRLAHRK